CTESSYTVGLIWGRPRLRKPRLEPHSPASSRPARRCATESRVPERVTRLMPSLSWAMPRVAVRRPARKRFCSRVGGGGGAIDSVGGRAAIEWTGAVGILAQDDLIHAARLGADAAAAVVERKDADQRVFIYFGPRMDAPPADPYEGTLLYDEPGVRAYIFAQRVHAIAHFLRATHGLGAVISMLGRRAPELRHIRRWLQAVFAEPAGEDASTQMLAGWFATSGTGVLFLPRQPDAPYTYCEVGVDL